MARDGLTRLQLALQLIVVLLLPFFGAVVVMAVALSNLDPKEYRAKLVTVTSQFLSLVFLSFMFIRNPVKGKNLPGSCQEGSSGSGGD